MSSVFTQEAISIASSILAIVCLSVPFLFKKELEGVQEKYYLIAFYISAIVHFLTVANPNVDDSAAISVFKSISIVNGALLPFFLSAFICVRDKEVRFLYLLMAIVIVNLITSFMFPHEVYLSVLFAFSSNVIGLIAVVKNIKNKADIGLSLCFILFLCALLFVLIKAPLHIDPVSFYENFYYWLLIFIPGFICGTTIFIFLRYVIEQNHELTELAHIDPLTGLTNRRFAFELINRNISYMNRKKRTYSVVMSDLDHFKSVNDTYGHPVGDSVIVKLAQVMLSVVREYDVACRYGGEEFLLFLPDTDTSQAEEIANRIRRSLKAEPQVAEGKSFFVTASFGVASGNMNTALTDVVSAADKALYQAKQNGRDKVVSFTDNKTEQNDNYAHAT